jgi:hypothetical protein
VGSLYWQGYRVDHFLAVYDASWHLFLADCNCSLLHYNCARPTSKVLLRPPSVAKAKELEWHCVCIDASTPIVTLVLRSTASVFVRIVTTSAIQTLACHILFHTYASKFL